MKIIVFLFLAFSFLACSPRFYAPNRINIPELKKKNDLKLTAAKGYLDLEIQSAYAITDHVGAMCNYVNTSFRNSNTNFESAGGSLLELGIGYFSCKNYLIFENYLTVGKGNFFNRAQYLSPIFEDDDGKLDSDFLKFGLQSTVTLQNNLFSLSTGIRFTDMKYRNVRGNMYYGYENLNKFLSSYSNYLFIEPVIQVGMGYKNVRFNVQYQRSYLLNPQDSYLYTKFNYSAGIQLSFPAIGSKKKQTSTIN